MKFNRPDYDNRLIDKDNRIPEDEPVFLLRGQDKLAPKLLLMWAMELRLAGGDPAMAENAEAHAQRMINWQKNHKCKTPDMYQDSYERIYLKDKIGKLLDSITNKVGVILVGELTDLLAQYYNTNNPPILILTPEDLNSDAKDKPVLLLTKDDFDPEKIHMLGIKIMIYVDSRLNSIVIMNNFV